VVGSSEHLFVLRRGLVSVSTQGVIRHYLSRGSFFGEVCLVYPHMRRSATLTALTPCELASLNRLDYEDVRSSCSSFEVSGTAQRAVTADMDQKATTLTVPRVCAVPLLPTCRL